MINEIKTLFNNIKNFRHLLTEGVGDNVIVNAINDHKFLYIYYAGDKTTLKGYRTIKPFVLGTTSKGNKVLRAWQENGSSDSYAGLTGRKREDHEYFYNKWKKTGNEENSEEIETYGTMKPGWRLFSVSGITSALPTGKKFSTEESKIPQYYNPNDSQMRGGIIASIHVTPDGSTKLTGTDSLDEPDTVKQQVNPPSEFDRQGDREKQFFKAGEKKREATADEIQALYDIATKVRRRSPTVYNVVNDDNGDLVLKDINDRRIKPERIVGNLKDLYKKFVEGNTADNNTTVNNNSFIDTKNKNAIKTADEKKRQNKTFFK